MPQRLHSTLNELQYKYNSLTYPRKVLARGILLKPDTVLYISGHDGAALWKVLSQFVRSNKFMITRSEGSTTKRIASKFGRALIIIPDDGSGAQDNSTNKMEYLYLVCDTNISVFCDISIYLFYDVNNKKTNNNPTNNQTDFADSDRDVSASGNARTKHVEKNNVSADSQAVNPHRQNAKIRIVGRSPNRYTNDFLKNKDVTLPLSTIEVKQKGEHVTSTNYSKESNKLSSERRSQKLTFSRQFWHLQTKRSTPLIFDDRVGTPAEFGIKFHHLP